MAPVIHPHDKDSTSTPDTPVALIFDLSTV